jgi:hypothetical protein
VKRLSIFFLITALLVSAAPVLAQTPEPPTDPTAAPGETSDASAEPTQAAAPETADPAAIQPAAAGNQTVYLPMIAKPSSCAAPAVAGPADGATLTNLLPVFQWSTAGAQNPTEVQITLASDREMSELLYEFSVSAALSQFPTPYTLDPQTTYFWTATLYCGSSASAPSPVRSFTTGPEGGEVLTAPMLLAPNDGSAIGNGSATLRWTEVSGAAGYIVSYFVCDQGNQSICKTSYVLTDTYQTTITLQAGKEYIWWVNAYNDYAVGRDSLRREFTTPGG